MQIVALSERHWQAVSEALGHPEWLDDPRFAGNDARMANRELVNEQVGEVIATAPAAEWVERITAAGGLSERVREVEEAWRDPLLAERGLIGSMADGTPMPLVSLARSADPQALKPAPALGEHTEAVLRELDT